MKKIRLEFFIPEKSSNIKNGKGSKFIQHQKRKMIQILHVSPENQMLKKGAKITMNQNWHQPEELWLRKGGSCIEWESWRRRRRWEWAWNRESLIEGFVRDEFAFEREFWDTYSWFLRLGSSCSWVLIRIGFVICIWWKKKIYYYLDKYCWRGKLWIF